MVATAIAWQIRAAPSPGWSAFLNQIIPLVPPSTVRDKLKQARDLAPILQFRLPLKRLAKDVFAPQKGQNKPQGSHHYLRYLPLPLGAFIAIVSFFVAAQQSIEAILPEFFIFSAVFFFLAKPFYIIIILAILVVVIIPAVSGYRSMAFVGAGTLICLWFYSERKNRLRKLWSIIQRLFWPVAGILIASLEVHQIAIGVGEIWSYINAVLGIIIAIISISFSFRTIRCSICDHRFSLGQVWGSVWDNKKFACQSCKMHYKVPFQSRILLYFCQAGTIVGILKLGYSSFLFLFFVALVLIVIRFTHYEKQDAI